MNQPLFVFFFPPRADQEHHGGLKPFFFPITWSYLFTTYVAQPRKKKEELVAQHTDGRARKQLRIINLLLLDRTCLKEREASTSSEGATQVQTLPSGTIGSNMYRCTLGDRSGIQEVSSHEPVAIL
ncbi:hypothetical protein L249_2969 [Ophiocordyceps polyrhachis-furcata BCC 54312]|uniref:Uncharacterized protein n=1 Tax=Ophiocordyceps polyrhachis-furcata BCC 54312 TaxID=1330021 RepID=A0A367LR27_9HYPO|nr:hypothetical protein L249_2969 [Ophiocordyceps polyrhachis-furcata BCC 54312]